MKPIDKEKLSNLIDAHVGADVAAGRVLGAALSIVQDGEEIYQKCFGSARVSSQEAVAEDTVFRIASMTKPITAVAALILIDKGFFQLDDKVSQFLPQFSSMQIAKIDENGLPKITGAAQTPITIRHLLTHTSGIASGPLFANCYYPQITEQDRNSLAAMTEFYAKLPLSFEPYTTFEYSATGAFDVLARIMEIVTDMPYDELLQKELFSTCDMPDTTFTPTSAQWARMIDMHNFSEGRAVLSPTKEGCVFEGYTGAQTAAGAGLCSTLHDYRNFARMLLDQGCFHGKQVLSAKTLSLMSTPQAPFWRVPNQLKWGLGVRVIAGEDYRILPVGTYGWSGAYGTHFWIDPVNKIAAIYLKNSRFDGGSGNKTGKQLEKDVFESLINK